MTWFFNTRNCRSCFATGLWCIELTTWSLFDVILAHATLCFLVLFSAMNTDTKEWCQNSKNTYRKKRRQWFNHRKLTTRNSVIGGLPYITRFLVFLPSCFSSFTPYGHLLNYIFSHILVALWDRAIILPHWVNRKLYLDVQLHQKMG